MTCQVRQGDTCTCRPSNPLPVNIVKNIASLFFFFFYSSPFSSPLLLCHLQTWRSGLLDPETLFLAWDIICVCRRFSSNVITLLVPFLQLLIYLRRCFWVLWLASVTSRRPWRNSLIWFNIVMKKNPRYFSLVSFLIIIVLSRVIYIYIFVNFKFG